MQKRKCRGLQREPQYTTPILERMADVKQQAEETRCNVSFQGGSERLMITLIGCELLEIDWTSDHIFGESAFRLFSLD